MCNNTFNETIEELPRIQNYILEFHGLLFENFERNNGLVELVVEEELELNVKNF